MIWNMSAFLLYSLLAIGAGLGVGALCFKFEDYSGRVAPRTALAVLMLVLIVFMCGWPVVIAMQILLPADKVERLCTAELLIFFLIGSCVLVQNGLYRLSRADQPWYFKSRQLGVFCLLLGSIGYFVIGSLSATFFPEFFHAPAVCMLQGLAGALTLSCVGYGRRADIDRSPAAALTAVGGVVVAGFIFFAAQDHTL